MARTRKYVIKLTDDELKTLKSIIRKSNTSKTIRSRCQIIIQVPIPFLSFPLTPLLAEKRLRRRKDRKSVV